MPPVARESEQVRERERIKNFPSKISAQKLMWYEKDIKGCESRTKISVPQEILHCEHREEEKKNRKKERERVSEAKAKVQSGGFTHN